MRKDIRRRHDAHLRAQSVCTEHSALFDVTTGGQTTRAAFGAQVADVDRLLALQQRSIEERRAATEQCRRSRRTLRNAGGAIVKVGRLVNLDAAIMATMHLPGPTSDDRLLAYARALLDRVSEHTDVFVAQGLPPDLLKTLGDTIEAFAAARDAQAASRQRFTAASESIRETLDDADKIVDVLEAIVVNTPAAHPEILTKLRIARRVGPRVTAAAAKPSPTPASASTPIDKAA